MSVWHSVRLSLAAVVVPLAWAPGGWAQSDGAGASTSSATLPLDAAKKEFEGIKSVREAALLPNGALPRIDAPEFHAPTTPVTGAPKTKAIVPAKPSNWLVDAMEQQEKSRDPRRKDARSFDRRKRAEPSDDDSDPAEREGHKAEREEPVSERDAPLVINPLTRYLDEWMTPQDFALLKPNPGKAFETGASARNSALPASDLTLGGLGELALGAAAAPSIPSTSPRENPYLEVYKLEPSVVGIVPKPPSSAPLSIRPPVPNAVVSPPPSPAAPTKIPEFAKPSTDEKYFKQLKRF